MSERNAFSLSGFATAGLAAITLAGVLAPTAQASNPFECLSGEGWHNLGFIECGIYSTLVGMTTGGLVAGFFFPPMSGTGSAGVLGNVAVGAVAGGLSSFGGFAIYVDASSRKVLNQAARDARAYFDDRAQGLDGTLAQQVLELRERGLARGLSAEEVSDDALAEKIVELDQAISLAEAGLSAGR